MNPSAPNSDFAYIKDSFRELEPVLCPICGVDPVPFAIDPDGFQLCRCRRCNLEFLNPRPTFSELRAKLYVDEYIPEEHSTPEYLALQQQQFNRQLRSLENLFRGKGRLLDVGCGDGRFIAYAMNRGWDVTGMDIRLYKQAREISCKLLEGQLTQLDLEPHSFDVIRFHQVLEHTQNPLAELERCRQLISPKGIIFVSVPNLASISSRLKSLQSRLYLKSRRWRHYAATHHLWYFTPATLNRLAEHAGLRVLQWETPIDPKIGRSPVVEYIYRWILEKPRCAGVLDAYCSPRH